MPRVKKAQEPFEFCTRLHLTALTGQKASNIQEFLDLIREVPGSCIYHHTHRFLQQHQNLSPEPPNDFAFWLINALNENVLAEKLASIDTVQFPSIRELREKIISTIENYIKSNPRCLKKFAIENEEFYFMKSLSFVVKTPHLAYSLSDFKKVLKKITIDSIYFHIFESRLRLNKGTNDFSYWFETSLGEKKLSERIAKLDPYTSTLEDLRKTIIKLIDQSIKESNG